MAVCALSTLLIQRGLSVESFFLHTIIIFFRAVAQAGRRLGSGHYQETTLIQQTLYIALFFRVVSVSQ